MTMGKLFTMALVVLLSWGCGSKGSSSVDGGKDLGSLSGKSDLTGIEVEIFVPAATEAGPGSATFTVKSTSSFRVKVTQQTQLKIAVKVNDALSETATAIDYLVRVEPSSSAQKFSITVFNYGDTELEAVLKLDSAESTTTEADKGPKLPSVTDEVQYANEYCTYQDKAPYVKSVNWTHPEVVAGLRGIGPGFRSTFAYSDWNVGYDLESESPRLDKNDYVDRAVLEAAEKYMTNGTATLQQIADEATKLNAKADSKAAAGEVGAACSTWGETQKCNEGLVCTYASSSSVCATPITEASLTEKYGADALTTIKERLEQWNDLRRDARARNFVRVLCGEYRDYPEMIKKKLAVVAANNYAGKDELETVDTSKNLFTQLTYPAYQRMVSVMSAMHSYRQNKLTEECRADAECAATIGFNYNFGEMGHNAKRVSKSVPPHTHCEMKFMFSRYMVKDAPSLVPATYEQEYAQYKESECSADDLSYMYNFRGHNNFKALWLESNAMIWNSRRARKVAISRKDETYYKRPFASRLLQSRKTLASYLFYKDEDHSKLAAASDSGGGPIMYITDQDTDNDGLLDYRLFSRNGCGDQGVGGTSPDSNCNMMDWDLAFNTANTIGHSSKWDSSWFDSLDMGFLKAFTTFEERMARFNQALDRHTNWGPTGYYMLDASDVDASPNQVKFMGAYSPIVACSYDISASNSFARRCFGTCDPYEGSNTKWMFIMRFPTKYYYDEKDMKDGKPFNFNLHYFNETSLSNDYYHERALDRFAFVPVNDVYANVYFVYGQRGDAPKVGDVPAP